MMVNGIRRIALLATAFLVAFVAFFWPWIVQIGYKRAGFYSWDILDNDGIPSAERIIPEYQNLKVGDILPLSEETDAAVVDMEPNSRLLLVS